MRLDQTSNDSIGPVLSAIDFSRADFRRDIDGWHVVLQISGVTHRLWLPEPPQSDVSYSVSLPLDDRFDIRAMAALRLWRSLAGRTPGDDPSGLTRQRRERLTQAMRALDGRNDGATYRDIAKALFGPARIPARAWKSHDLRGRTIRLVATGYDMMRGGYRKLLGMFRERR